jgi:hypothetical protein
MKIAALEVDNDEQLKALRDFAKTRRIKFIGIAELDSKKDTQEILEGIASGFKESLSLEKGEQLPKGIQEVLNGL